MDEVTRYDAAGRLSKAVRTDAGWLRAPATVTRVGVLTYRQKDGTIRRELRLPEEVLKAESLASLATVPVTREHPATPSGLLDAATAKQFAVGHTGERVDTADGKVNTSIVLTDPEAIGDVERGEREQLSAGYRLRLDMTPGVHPEFGPYDAVQRDIRYNHVALTRAGRAGPEVRLHLDSDAIEVADEQREDSAPMVKRKINGVDFEVSEQIGQAIDAETAALRARADALEAEAKQAKDAAAAATARADAAEAARKDSDDPTKIAKAVAARLDLERKAGAVLGASVALDALTDAEIMTQVVTKALPSMADKLKAAEPAYLAAAFDVATASHKPAPSDKVAGARTDTAGGGARTDAETARQKMIADQRARGQNPIPTDLGARR